MRLSGTSRFAVQSAMREDRRVDFIAGMLGTGSWRRQNGLLQHR